MARAYLCLPWPSLFLLFWLLFCSISSIQVSFSEWIVVARAASVFDGRSPTLELTEATRDRSKARSNIGGDDAPPWHNVTVVFSIAPSSASYLGTRLHARALSFHCSGSYRPALFRHAGPSTLAMNTTAAMGIFSVATVAALDWCRLAWSHGRPGGVSSSATCRGSSITKRRAILISDVDSSRIQDYSLGEEQQLSNSSTDFLSPIFTWFQDQAIEIGLSLTETSRNISFACNDSAAASLEFPSLLQGHTNIRVDRAGISYRRRRLRDEPTARRLLPRAYGRRSARKKHVAVATRGQVASSSSWLAQAYVAGLAFFGLICAVVAGLILLCCIRGKGLRQSTAAVELEDDGEPTTIREPQVNRRLLGPRMFNYCQLAAVTDDFAEERKIGRGGFGPVYRGYLSEEDRHVAVKVLSQDQSVQGLKEFEAEVTIVSQLRHRNIIQLIGWSESRRGGPALVYEFMPGGSLDAHLYSPDTHLTWSQRHKIALALGSALRYLHADCDQCVVHGDIKPANVMLDASGNAKLGDFGLARLVGHGAEPQTTRVVAGTVGYIDPELISSRRPSTESDVYSFGVVLLEIACGRRPASSSRQAGQAQAQTPAALLAFAREMYHRNMVLDMADRRLDGVFDGLQMERLLVTGLWCAQQDPIRRPSITQAMDVLRSEDAKLPVLPNMPAGSGQVQSLETQAYGDLSDENSVSLSDVTAYFTDEESAYLIVQEE